MAEAEDDLVLLETCASNVEASVLRSLLESSGIFVYVQGEEHRALLGVLGPYIALNVLVRRADRQAAEEILSAFRARPAEGVEEAPAEKSQQETRGEEAFRLQEEPSPAEEEAGPRDKRIGLALLMAFTLTFGCGHLYAGARLRGVALAIAEGCGLLVLSHFRLDMGLAIVALAIASDAIGSAVHVRRLRNAPANRVAGAVGAGLPWAVLAAGLLLWGFAQWAPELLWRMEDAANLRFECFERHAHACTQLGILWDKGERGDSRDAAQAVALYRRACDGDDMLGCAWLAVHYATGEGVAQDVPRAVSLLRGACEGERSDPSYDACATLARLYDLGRGVERDEAKAHALYQKACSGGIADACWRTESN